MKTLRKFDASIYFRLRVSEMNGEDEMEFRIRVIRRLIGYLVS